MTVFSDCVFDDLLCLLHVSLFHKVVLDQQQRLVRTRTTDLPKKSVEGGVSTSDTLDMVESDNILTETDIVTNRFDTSLLSVLTSRLSSLVPCHGDCALFEFNQQVQCLNTVTDL